MGVGASDTTAPERVIRCVLWHARGAVLPGALVAALDRPQVQWKAWDSEYLALAEAMLKPADHSMKLEAQGVTGPERERQRRLLADTLLNGSPRKLWQ